MPAKTYQMKAAEIDKQWLVIDAEGAVLGRLASQIALLLKGKHKPTYQPNLDCGDNVVVINAEKVALTGKKDKTSIFYYHTGFPGGLKERTKGDILRGAHPERLIENAVRRMVKREALGRMQMKNLRVYVGAEHPHVAQNPTVFDFKSKNTKNVKRA